MSSILSSQGVVFATAMVVSSTVLFLTFSRQKTFPSDQYSENHDSQLPPKQSLRSCLCSEQKKKERKKKRVKFAENVKDTKGNGDEYRKGNKKSTTEVDGRICRNEISGIRGIPANRVALYNGILRDRVQRTVCSY